MTLRGTYCVSDGIVTVTNSGYRRLETGVPGLHNCESFGDAATTNGISSLTRTATMSRASPPLCGDPE
jgi:hypothetical protein